MEKLWKLIGVFLIVSFCMACQTYRHDDDFYEFPCERDNTGNICFQNDTHRRIRMDIGNTEFEIAGFSTICVDMYAGDYNYKGKQGLHRWRGSIPVYRCEQYFIELDR